MFAGRKTSGYPPRTPLLVFSELPVPGLGWRLRRRIIHLGQFSQRPVGLVRPDGRPGQQQGHWRSCCTWAILQLEFDFGDVSSFSTTPLVVPAFTS